MQKKTIVSGSRPTGNIHLGNYFGAIENWVSLQEQYDCNFFIADWHALTTGYADTEDLRKNTLSLAADYIASGIDPEKCTLFLQSEVKQHAELFLLLAMNTPLSWLKDARPIRISLPTSRTAISRRTVSSGTPL